MKKFFLLGLAVVLVFISGCGPTATVKPVSQSSLQVPLTEICIVDNPKVIANNFVPAIQKRLDYHGIKSRVVESKKELNLPECAYHMEYTAKQTWDFALFLSYAQMHLYLNHNQIGSAIYHLKVPNFPSTRHASTYSKISPLIDELLGKKQADK